MQVFNVGVFLQPITFQILILIQKKKSEKSEKVYQNPHTQAKLLPLGAAWSRIGIDVRAVDRKRPQKTWMSTQKEGYKRQSATFPWKRGK